jgi:putative spermidine/putrescine transport system ATP-binding protein
LSGGQQQRVALARALALKPQILLLDEPLSALDAKIRVSLREEIRSLQRQLGITTIFVTHDQEEALSMSDRIVVMSEGRIEQVGSPFDIYNFPATRFVASFVGTLSLLEGAVVDPSAGLIKVDGRNLRAARGLPGARVGDRCTVALRPEGVQLGDGSEPANRMQGTIGDIGFLGSVVRVRVQFDTCAIMLDLFNKPGLEPLRHGAAVTVSFNPDNLIVLDVRSPS